MVQTLVAAIAVVVLIIMSVRANRRFRDEDRLPMQWSFTGLVNWTAPRLVALAFTPVLATIILIAAVAGSMLFVPRSGQEGMELPVILFIAVMFVGIHALHLWLADKALRKSR